MMSYWAESMLLWSWQSLLLVAILLMATSLLRRSSAADRYRLWFVGMVAVSALPIANVIIVALPIASPPVESVRYVAQPVEETVLPKEREEPTPVTAPSPAVEAPTRSWRPYVLPVLFVAWVAGILISVARPLRSYLESRRLRATAAIAPLVSLRLLAGYSSQVRAPLLAGIFRPMVLLPADIAHWADPEEQQAMVLHEAAHFDRRDHLANLFQALVGAVLFFHPAVRYALRQLVLERELACDEHVLKAGVRPAVYAEALLKAAERTLGARRAYEPAFPTSGRILDRRMTMIMNYRDSMSNGSRMLRVAKTLAVIGVAVLLLPDRADISGVRLSVPVLVAGVPVLSAALPPATLQAQAPAEGVSLSGTIYDQSRNVIPGVTVRLVSPRMVPAGQQSVMDPARTPSRKSVPENTHSTRNCRAF